MYLNWQEKAALADPLYWYSTTALIQYLHALREFIITSPSDDVGARIPQLEKTLLPASRTVRFPGVGRYMCESFGGINNELSRLSFAINVMVNVDKVSRTYPDFKTPVETKDYALEKINHLLTDIQYKTNEANTFGRQSFEEHYKLVWQENTV